MSATVNPRIQFKRDTTENWNHAIGFIPLEGEVIIYMDYETTSEVVNGALVNNLIPGIKIGDGSTYVQDLPFVDDELRTRLINHMNNKNVHTTVEEKLFWNNKINVNDRAEVVEGALIFNRN